MGILYHMAFGVEHSPIHMLNDTPLKTVPKHNLFPNDDSTGFFYMAGNQTYTFHF